MKRVVLIVEGINDEKQISRAFGNDSRIKTLVTEGTKVDSKIIDEINEYINKGFEPYVLSDPDTAGENLSNMIQHHFPSIERINVDINECGYYTGKKLKAGIEYSSYDYLKTIIYPLIGERYKKKEYPICWD